MYPVRDDNHASEGAALLTDHYKSKPVITGILKSLMASVQEIEGVLWDVIESHYLATPPVGDQLDQIGTVVGEARNGLDDADYLELVRLKIRVNRSQGLSRDVIDVGVMIRHGGAIRYVEQGPVVSCLLECDDIPAPNVVAPLLTGTRGAGCYGELHYTTWAPGQDLRVVSRHGGGTAQGVFGSRHGGALVGLVPAAISF